MSDKKFDHLILCHRQSALPPDTNIITRVTRVNQLFRYSLNTQKQQQQNVIVVLHSFKIF